MDIVIKDRGHPSAVVLPREVKAGGKPKPRSKTLRASTSRSTKRAVKAANKPVAAMPEGVPVSRGRRYGNMNMPVLLVRESTAAKMLSITLRRLKGMIARGELACVLVDGARRIQVRAIERLAATETTPRHLTISAKAGESDL